MSNDPRPRRERGPLRRAWSDLTAGSNLEIYATTLASLALALLGVFDVVAPAVVAAATLATLALLALSTLGSRHQVQDLRRSIDTLTEAVNNAVPDDLPVHRFLAVKAPDLHDELRGAADIRLHASRPVLADRLARRSRGLTPTAGLAGDELIGQPQARLREIADRAARTLDALDGLGDLRVDTDGRPADEIATEILARTGWPSPPR